MISKGQRISEVEQLRQADRKAAPGHPVIQSPRIVRTKEPEQWLSVPAVPSSSLLTSGESFITDWADS